MTEESLQRISRNYDFLANRMPEVTHSFYRRLFSAHPELRPLFRLDIAVQSQHLASALALIVRNLRLMDALEHPLMDLGAGHASVGTRPEHYPVVCRTMIEAMREASGGQWSAALEQDWVTLLQHISRIMMNGALRRAASQATQPTHPS
jgi:nitric oxide dioxygenase